MSHQHTSTAPGFPAVAANPPANTGAAPDYASASSLNVTEADAAGLRGQHEYDFDDAAADRWTNAALAAFRGKPCPGDDLDSISGYRHGLEGRRVRVVMPDRPEGYWHTDPRGEA